MNRRKHALVWTVGLCVLGIMVLNSCITVVPTPEPTPEPIPTPEPTPTPAPEPEPAHPTTPILSTTDLRNQIAVLEWPSQAYVGEYITVRIKTMSDEFWQQLKDELIEANQGEALSYIGKEATYELVICKDYPEAGVYYDHSLGTAMPDNDLIVSWYVSIPVIGGTTEYNHEKGQYEWVEGPFFPGNYKMEFRLLDPCSNGSGFCGYDVMVERNIIIKD